MQIQNKWHKETCLLTKAELKNPDLNLNCGTKILKKYLVESKNNLLLALQKYNGGYSGSQSSKKYARIVYSKYLKSKRYA
jgi:soluble lytic murein transglycosylase-like protein